MEIGREMPFACMKSVCAVLIGIRNCENCKDYKKLTEMSERFLLKRKPFCVLKDNILKKGGKYV